MRWQRSYQDIKYPTSHILTHKVADINWCPTVTEQLHTGGAAGHNWKDKQQSYSITFPPSMRIRFSRLIWQHTQIYIYIKKRINKFKTSTGHWVRARALNLTWKPSEGRKICPWTTSYWLRLLPPQIITFTVHPLPLPSLLHHLL